MGKKQKWWERLEFVTRNITASMDATDADVRDLTDRVEKLIGAQESMKSISKTHTLWLERLGKRIATLEDRLSPPSEAVENDYVYTCPTCDRSFSFYTQKTMDEYVRHHATTHQLPSVEYAERTQKAHDPHTQELLDFGLWLSEELTGTPISRADLESCLTDWKTSR